MELLQQVLARELLNPGVVDAVVVVGACVVVVVVEAGVAGGSVTSLFFFLIPNTNSKCEIFFRLPWTSRYGDNEGKK